MKNQLKTLDQKVKSLQIGLHKENEEVQSANDEGNQSKKVNSFKCQNCDFNSKNKFQLMKHVKGNYPKKVECDLCEIPFDSNIDLEVHMKTHEKPKILILTYVVKTFSDNGG